MASVARKGDTASHPGIITTGSPTGSCNGRPIARIGDTFKCEIHGEQPIITGSGGYSLDGRKVARVGDLIACLAIINSGSPDHHDE